MNLASRGFTLIEALIAMFIVALALVAVTTKVSLAAKIASRTQQSTYGRWVAMNAITELRLKPGFPAIGRSDGDEELAGQEFRWTMDISNTPAEGIRRVEVTVASDKQPDQIIFTTSAFVGTNNPQASVRPWEGLPDDDDKGPGGQIDPPAFPNPRNNNLRPGT